MSYTRMNGTDKADIMRLRALGFKQKEIAAEIGYSEQSISYQISLLRKYAETDAEDLIYNMFSHFTGISVTDLVKMATRKE